ncbi:MAG: hypothetical protein HQK76_03300 [Desulfobacterales bacterium]|nr:hypothetical protein [Desulfobacterales bacterium]
MNSEDKLKTVAQEISKISDDIKDFLSKEDDISKMADADIILRGIAATLYKIASASIAYPDLVLEMCELCLQISDKRNLNKKVDEFVAKK